MALLREEQEITITKLATENVWEVYTSDKRYANKLNKIGANAYMTESIDGEQIAWFYRLDENQILIRQTPKKRVLTDEQKAEMIERLRQARENKKM